ncbi:hypothetical protein [uncultured Sneathia sp.]|uniref:hypothetical protein n=1 Tax=uncultured Sneathia sp. TaxID=278067 RepID=UPI002595EEBC|nr:hypothetical protein [uncultured Sneathia sp.]
MLDNNKQEPFYQVPKALIEMVKQGELTHTEVLIYMLVLDRLRLTKYYDDYGRYMIITRKEIQGTLKIPKLITISKALKKGEELKLFKIIRTKGKATKYYEHK